MSVIHKKDKTPFPNLTAPLLLSSNKLFCINSIWHCSKFSKRRKIAIIKAQSESIFLKIHLICKVQPASALSQISTIIY